MATVHKTQKIQCYYATALRDKPNKVYVRHYIHSRNSGGLWANIRDLMQKEKLNNEAVGQEVVVKVTIGYNSKFIENWEKIIVVDKNGNTYKLKEKPDEFEYNKSDIKFNAYLFREEHDYEEDIYDE